MAEINLEALLGKTEEQAKKEYINGLISDVKKKVILPILQAGLGKESVTNLLCECDKKGYYSVLCLPSYISFLDKQILSCNSKVGVVIGYPLGENVLGLTLKEIKVWAKSAISEIVVVLPLSDIKFNKCKNSEKILKNLAKLGKKKLVSVMVESSKLNDTELAEISKKVTSYKINKVYLSTGSLQENFEERIINAYKNQKNKHGVNFVALNSIQDITALQKVVSSVDYIVGDKATILLEETLAKVSV